MNELQNKKISVLLILFSILGLLTSFLIKEPYDEGLQIYYEKNNASMPFTAYSVNLLFINFNLRRLVIFFVIVFGLGLYTFIYKNDEQIKSQINFIKNKFSKK